MSNTTSDSPVSYDFHARALKDIVFARKSQSNSDNFRGVPAVIVGISDYEKLQCVDVQVSINDLFEERDNLVLTHRTLNKVFVSLPRFGDFVQKYPVEVGGLVRLQHSHRDLGDYLDGDGSSVDLNINEIGQLEDCWCTLDGGTRKNNNSPSVDNFIIESSKTKITLFKNGDADTEVDGVITSSCAGATHTAPTTTFKGNVVIEGDLTVTENSYMGGMVTAPSGIAVSTTMSIDGVEVSAHFHIQSDGTSQTEPMS